MTYVAVAVSLSSIPVLKALAFNVMLVLTATGLVYKVEEDEGSEPLVV